MMERRYVDYAIMSNGFMGSKRYKTREEAEKAASGMAALSGRKWEVKEMLNVEISMKRKGKVS